MAKPEQAKDIKPKTEGETAAPKAKPPVNENMKVIIINLVTTLLICVLFTSVTYVLMSSLLDSKLSAQTKTNADGDATADDSGSDGGEEDAPQKGFILDLGDFILNLSDVSPRKYLKVNVALEVSNKPEEVEAATAAPAKKEGGEGGEGAAAANPLEEEMAQFKPAIRDAIITNLSSKTSAELSTVAGKELAKEQIAEAVNGLFAGEREVIRVSFGQFIIQ
jgi:flagellar FliL protein